MDQCIRNTLSTIWKVSISLCNSADSGDATEGDRYVIHILHAVTLCVYETVDHTVTPINIGYGRCLYTTITKLEAHTNMNISRNTTLSSDTNRAHVVAALHFTSAPSIFKISSSNCILDPNYPALEPSPDNMIMV